MVVAVANPPVTFVAPSGLERGWIHSTSMATAVSTADCASNADFADAAPFSCGLRSTRRVSCMRRTGRSPSRGGGRGERRRCSSDSVAEDVWTSPRSVPTSGAGLIAHRSCNKFACGKGFYHWISLGRSSLSRRGGGSVAAFVVRCQDALTHVRWGGF